MLGVALLVLSLLLYFSKKGRLMSYFLYVGFLLDGYGILIDPLLGGTKNGDLALVYTVLISILMVLKDRYHLPFNATTCWFGIFLAFLMCSAVFSYFHYDIPLFYIIQGGRLYLLILSLPILINISTVNAKKLIRIFAIMTIVIGIVDLIQIIFQIPILPTYDLMFDSSTGLYRFFNYPKFTEFFLLICIICPRYYGKYTKYVMVMLVVCLLGTLGRSLMLITLISVVLTLYFLGKTTKIVRYILIISFFTLPFLSIVIDRFSGDSNTMGDIQSVVSGNIEMVDYTSEKEGTFTYRISWVLERWIYLVNRPFGEQFFGLGLISDSSELSKKMYDFVVNIIFYESNMVQQLRSPDIAYGTMLAYLVFGGSVIYLIFYWKMMIAFFRKRTENPYFLVITVLMITGLALSLFGDSLSNPSAFALHYILLGLLFKNINIQDESIIYNRNH